MTTNYIYYIIYATITNFDIFTIGDHLICLSKCLCNKFCNIGFNIFTKWWVVPDDVSPTISSIMCILLFLKCELFRISTFI